MFVVLLKFSEARDRAPGLMEGHKRWLERGFEDGIFLLAGSLQPSAGGAVVAHGTTLEALQARVEEDPFVAEGVVTAEILAIDASRADDRLDFLLGAAP